MVIQERIKNLAVENLTVKGRAVEDMLAGAAPDVAAAVAAIPKGAGGRATLTGTGTVAVPGMAAIAAVVVSLAQDASLAAIRATATWSGTTVTIKVTRPTSNLDGTPQPATSPAVVSWIAFGS